MIEIFVFDNGRFAFDSFCLVLFENVQIKVNILKYNIQVFIFFTGASVVSVHVAALVFVFSGNTVCLVDSCPSLS